MESEGSNSSGEDETHNRVPKYNQIFGQGYLFDVVHLGDLGKSESSSTILDELAENVIAAEADNQPTGVVDNESTVNQPALDTSLNPESSRAEGDLYDVVKNYLGDLGKPKYLDELPENVRAAEAEKKTFDEDWTFTLGKMISSSSTLRGGGHMAFPRQNQWMQYQIPTIPQQQQDMLPVFMPGHPVQQPVPGAENRMIDTMMASFLMGSASDTQNQESSARARARRQQRMTVIKEARSRARKEANYLQELESKLSRLKLETEKLKRMKEAEKLLPSKPATEPTYQLRRTSSSPI
ncbi:Hypothetical predicted protein [Olea europaea subsp. europaea]|uniref:BZIP domain-containing protein n=1 Tax=Olea europaea subsp. europaea TaxID=158383 RepID=A0A8S0R8K4_OLEEU|nr:Hypothetical predicted protein [Olea europaea subsp. europaea]